MTAGTSEWESLLELAPEHVHTLIEGALPVLDHVFGPPDPSRKPDWTLGGGTAIMLQIGHRVSRDIDIFVPGTRLKLFTRAQDPAASRSPGGVQWPGH